MSDIFILRPHSFVDTITNSSTEVFIYSGDKDVKVIDTVLRSLVNAIRPFSKSTLPSHEVFTIEKARKNFKDKDWGYSYKKGDIVIELSECNDFDAKYTLYGFLEQVLNAEHHHLG